MSKSKNKIPSCMNVKDLIKKLSKYKDDDLVYISVDGSYDYLNAELIVDNDVVIKDDYGDY